MVNVIQNGTSLCTGLSALPQLILNWQTKSILLYTCTCKQVCVVLIDSNSCPDLCIADKAQRPNDITAEISLYHSCFVVNILWLIIF